MQTAQIIPFQFEAREIRTLLIDDQPWFVAADVCHALAIRNNRDAIARLDDDEKGVATTDTLRGAQELGIINESGLYSLILTSRKAEAKRFKKWVTAEVLPAIRRHDRYEAPAGLMDSILSTTIGTDGFHCLGTLLDGKLRRLPLDARRGAKQHVWSQVRKAFSVSRIEDIPAQQLDNVRNFVAAYAIEGEFLGKEDGGLDYPISRWLAESKPLQRHVHHGRLRLTSNMLLTSDYPSPLRNTITALEKQGVDMTACRVEFNSLLHQLEIATNGLESLRTRAQAVLESGVNVPV